MFFAAIYGMIKEKPMGNIRLFAAGRVCALALVLLSAACLPATALGYEVLSPSPGGKETVKARRSSSHLVIRAADKAEAANLEVGRVINRDGDTKTVAPVGTYEKDGAVYVHYVLDLKKGRNIYALNPGEKELVIRYQPLRTLLKLDPDDPDAYLFHRTDVVPSACALCHDEKLPGDANLDVETLRKNADFSPVCYSCHRRLTSGNKWLHGPAAAVACMTCHRKGDSGRKITTLTGRVDETCFSCHINRSRWMKKSFIHGPVATGDCTVCHDPHGADFPFMLWADPKMDICIACHTNKKGLKRKKSGFVEHGILAGQGCSACHSPHATNHRFQLAAPVNEVCASCHVSMKGISSGHPVGKHPLYLPVDPRRKDREFTCASCHNPHGAKYKNLLIGSVLGGHVCSKCHN